MKAKTKKKILNISKVLAGIGAVNWGLIGVAKTNLVTTLLGTSGLTTFVYVVVGVAGAIVLADVLNILK